MESKSYSLVLLCVFALIGLFCETQGASYSNYTSNYLTTYNSRRGSKDIRIPESHEQRSFRNSKLFPLFTVIRFTNEVCRTNNDETGVCYTRTQCNALGGLAQGSCASGLGVCCRFIATCGAIVYQNGTSFQNPNYPSKYVPVGGSDVCQIRIRKQNNVCQLKLHFHVFDVEGPIPPTTAGNNQQNMEAGVCKTDSLAITSSGASIPSICGTMNDQHLYVDFGSSDTITLNLLLGGATQRERTWNIEILTIPCNSVARAPTGCLQYFTGVSGTVESFNFQGGLHLANLDYSVCLRMEDGMRFVDWMPCTANSVRFGNGPVPVPPSPGQNTPCPNTLADYLVIAQGISFPFGTGTGTGMTPTSTSDRFCDTSFLAVGSYVRTSAKPFIMHIRTDMNEGANGDVTSVGFCFRWQQNPQ